MSPEEPDWAALTPALIADRLDPVTADQFPPDVTSAVVAVVLRPGPSGPELLFIERATRDNDPWSGQVAFPGGRSDPTDRSKAATAERETMEEVGLDLTNSSAQPLGALTTIDGGRAVKRVTLVAAHVYWLNQSEAPLSPNDEVAEVIWMPLAELVDPARRTQYYYPGVGLNFPGIRFDVNELVLWGLTLRFVGDLFQRLEIDFIDQPPINQEN